jgi:acid phosphatase class B
MPIQIKSENGKCFARWGNQGHKYFYTCGNAEARKEAKNKALAQGVAIEKFAAIKVSFDFDDTITTEKGQNLAKERIKNGDSVYIVTRRHERDNKAVFKIADELGIPHDKVYFTNGHLKWETIKRLGIDIHYDNNLNEIQKINENTNAKGILIQ